MKAHLDSAPYVVDSYVESGMIRPELPYGVRKSPSKIIHKTPFIDMEIVVGENLYETFIKPEFQEWARKLGLEYNCIRSHNYEGKTQHYKVFMLTKPPRQRKKLSKRKYDAAWNRRKQLWRQTRDTHTKR